MTLYLSIQKLHYFCIIILTGKNGSMVKMALHKKCLNTDNT